MIFYSNSTEVGRIIQKGTKIIVNNHYVASALSNLKNVTLELGGKSPLIILDDANIDEAIEIANFGIFYNHGQCCCASSRIFVQEGIYDKFVARSVELAKKRKVGDPLDPTTEQGPVCNPLLFF